MFINARSSLVGELRAEYRFAYRLILTVCILAGIALPEIGRAQQARVAVADTEPGQQNGSGLEEIVVTAQRREQNLQDVPIKVTAVTAEMLETTRTVTTQDLQFLAPSLVYNQVGGFAQPSLRGVGSDFTSPDVDEAVAMYIDGAFVADSQSTIQNLLGVERVEVLAGPQGTLFGRNALAGAISITTLTPQQEFQEHASVTRGNYNDLETTAQISGGVTSDLAVGLYAATTRSDSIYYRPFVSGQPDHNDEDGVRLKAVYTPIDKVKLTGSIEYTEHDSLDLTAFRQGQVNSLGSALGAPVVVGPYQLNNDYPDKNTNRGLAATLKEEVDLNAVQVVGISNYRSNRSFTQNDLDATSAPIFGGYAYGTNRQVSQELQVLSPKGQAIEWITGLYYYRQVGGQVPDVNQSTDIPPANTSTTGMVRTESYAGFGQATYSPVENLRITLGGRYTDETKTIYLATLQLAPVDGVLPPALLFPDQSKTWEQFTPKFEIDYRIGQTLLYASFDEGFQSGAFNTLAPNDAPANPEKLKSYSIGSKSDVFDGRLRVNVDAYYYNFTDLQVSIDTAGTGSGENEKFVNAANAQAYGLEASAQAAVTSNFRLNAQVAWERTKYTQFENYPAEVPSPTGGYATVDTNVTGNPLPRAPKWVGTLAADYHTEVSWGGEMKANLGWYYNGGFAWDSSNYFRQSAYELLNGSLAYTLPSARPSASGRWTVAAWAKNIANRNYQDAVYPIAFGLLTQDGIPRTYGVTLSYNY
jgi:outer membrane receptor protein involved in Fe transport